MNTLAAYLYSRGLIEHDEDLFSVENAMNITQRVDECLEFLYNSLNDNITDSSTEEEIQYWYYEAGKLHFSEDLRYWFRVIYNILIKEESGPRLGQFTRTFGVDRILDVIYNVRNGSVLSHWGWNHENRVSV